MKTSQYKKEILEILNKKHLLSISEIHKLLGTADYSTVFRNIEQLLVEKKIKKVMIDNKSTAYESVDEKHDHFICNDCGKVEEIHLSHGSIKGYKVEDITVRGSCDKCIE